MDQRPMPRHPSQPAVDRGPIWGALAILYIVWGSTYLGIAVAVETIPPFLMAAFRFTLAGGVLLGWTLLRRSFAPPTPREWRDTFIVGALLLGGGMGMVAWGEQTIPSGIAALLVAMMPVWVAILGRVFLGQHLPRLAVIGIVVGFVGVAILVGPTALGDSGSLDPAGVAALIISPLAWCIGSLYASHRALLPRQPLVATGAQMLAGGIVLTGMAGVSGEFGRFSVAAVSPESVAAFLYLVVIGSLLAFTAYGWLLRKAPLPLIATYAYVNPVVAVILGAIVLREPIEARTLVAGAVIVGAVALIVTARGRMTAPRPDGGHVRSSGAPSPERATART
ncbi:MAG: EamA family transporter [Candidatus Limnocylindrales bacterium]